MASSPAPSQLTRVFDKHLTTLVHCLLNVVHAMMLVMFLETGLFWICLFAKNVSPVDSWKGFAYNLWFGGLVIALMLAFRNTLECLILFENSKRSKETTTVIAVDKGCAHFKHVDNGSNNTAWTALAGLIVDKFFDKAETNEAGTAPNEKDAKEATTTATEDDIKQDVPSASSSACSAADTSDLFNSK